MKKILKHPLTFSLIFLAGLSLAALTTPKSGYQLQQLSDFIKNLLDKSESVAQEFPEDRVYLHLDKPFYKPGENIWFKAYIRNGADMKASQKSEILYVELINPKGSIEKNYKLIAKKGLASGDFILDDNSPGGLYKIKAYTNWQKNEPNAPIFEKDIQVQAVVLPKLKMKLDFDRKAFGAGDEVSATAQLTTLENLPLANKAFRFVVHLDGKKLLENKGITSADGNAFVQFKLPGDLKTNDGLLNIIVDHEGNNESISRSVPIILNTIDFSLFPEGGDLVAGLSTKVAFKAMNEFGKPADVEGYIENSKGEKITSFKSYHQGMGAFEFKPVKDEKYVAKISQPKNIRQTFELPEALPRGYGLNVTEIKQNEIKVTVSSTEFEEMYLVAQVRGKIYHSEKLQANYGSSSISIPTNKFPVGVTQLTLFDSKGIERAERLAFVNKDKQLKIKIETDKEKYLPREKVKLTVKVTDDRDIPMPADFSLSVTDDKLLSFADDRSGTILSKLLLEYDIKEKIEEPAFYFDPKEEKANTALDYLLMTSGWRRFTWEQVLENSLPAISYLGEKAIVMGTVIDGNTNEPIVDAKIEVLNTSHFTETNEKGKFSLNHVDLTEGTTLKITSNGYSDQHIPLYEYSSSLNIALYNYDNYYNKAERVDMQPKRKAGPPRIQENKFLPPMVEQDAAIPEMVAAPAAAVDDEKPQFKKAEELVDDIDFAKEGEVMEEVVILGYATGNKDKGRNAGRVVPKQTNYYRARKFASPVYSKEENVEMRTDFRSTIYWNGNVATDRTGKATIEFYNSDEITSFRIIAEGLSADGMIGRSEKVYFTQLPFSMSVKAPAEVTFGDLISIPLTLKNNTSATVSGTLNILNPDGLKVIKPIQENQTVAANQTKTIYLDYKVLDKPGKGNLQISFNSSGLKDAFVQEITVSPKGFPAAISISGKDLEKEYQVAISNVVDGSLQANFTAYPSVVTDLMKGIESIIREPYGCFEQTSTSNYPNILVKQYLQEMGEGGGKKKIPMPAGLDAMLEKGYKKLVSYETKEKGYEWFGGAPAHEALTAYGLMQFKDMEEVYSDVDKTMVDRTANWLMGRKDGNGGFKRSGQALDQFGRASEEITNAYIVYALSEAEYRDIEKELTKAYDKAMSSKDPYQLALVANALFNMKDLNRGNKALSTLGKLQQDNGAWIGLTHSITYSQGSSLTIETTALTVMALIKSGNADGNLLNKGMEYLVSSRSGYGGFGSTQGTVLALKALTEYAKYSKKTDEDGTVEIIIDGATVASKPYKAGETNPIAVTGLEKYLSEGKHSIRVKYVGVKNPLPYSMAITYNTFLPNSSKQCSVLLKTEIKTSSLLVGETARLTAYLSNTTKEGLPMTMAIIGIPAGMTAQPWQLKEMQEKQIVDFYEVVGNTVYLYYRQMKPEERKIIHLDLKAEIPGEFEAVASSAYLYYTNEFKSWSKPEKITIKK